MSPGESGRAGVDVHLTVFLHGLRLDYRACSVAADLFLQEWTAHHGAHTAAVLADEPDRFPRLPCERLYLTR
ncbi:hypothetical protein [Nocardia flavorosea]|uniref:hypothetical protein n=1 Tax=Nocardia flavorosea TaxID=53429 RepID=UPI000AE96D67|nr:hypothetical protein [Nocardia flavorosea]